MFIFTTATDDLFVSTFAMHCIDCFFFLCHCSRISDELEEDCFESSAKEMLDFQTPIQANAHLYSYSSNLNLPEFESGSGLDPKIQK